MTPPKRCGQCERFCYWQTYQCFGCVAKNGKWDGRTAYSPACRSFRPKERLDPRHDPDPLPQDAQEREERRRYPVIGDELL